MIECFWGSLEDKSEHQLSATSEIKCAGLFLPIQVVTF
jgi:hypothetical protein